MINSPEDNLKKTFSEFTPGLSSDTEFMSRLDRRLEAVESVRLYISSRRRRTRRAVVCAAAAGFVCGMLAMLIFPMVRDTLIYATVHFVTIIQLSAAQTDLAATLVTWSLMAVITGGITWAVYDIIQSATRIRAGSTINVNCRTVNRRGSFFGH